ncbi:CBS domain-containing protein [Nocardia brasiliensis]|uniref:CBS domain-containing protein n=1 Tax=Nocardia brasiliensis TaxID=37326 RepID=UPI002455BEDE|nr:CBS domain-containing protein [Nocardia brasiliensis]
MKHKKAGDVMTRDVVSVWASTSFQQIVRTLAEQDISAVPVLGPRGRVLGVVTEADLLARPAKAGGALRGVVQFLLRRNEFARRSPALTAADLMTAPAVTVQPELTLTAVSALLARRGLEHLPVVDADGRLVGTVSRKDLLSVYLRDDAELADEIGTEVLLHAMCLAPQDVSVEVVDGIVTLRGRVERRSMLDVITALTATVDGVVDVHNDIVAEVDDTHLPPPPPENVGIFHLPTKH